MSRPHAENDVSKGILQAKGIETITDVEGEMLGVKFSYAIHDKRIAVLVSYDAPSGYDQRADVSIPTQYLDRYEEAGWWSDGAKDSEHAEERLDAINEEIEKVIHNVCHDMLMELGGPPPPALHQGRKMAPEGQSDSGKDNVHRGLGPRTLHEYMYPESFVVQLVSQNGQLKCIRRDDLPPPTLWPPHSEIAKSEDEAEDKLPNYTPSQLLVLKPFMFHRWVLLVSTHDGQTFCCKLSAGHGDSFSREYHVLRRIRTAGCTTESLKVPQLRGLVRSDVGYGEGIVGLLMDYIDTECYELTFHLAPARPSVSLEARNDSTNQERGNDNHESDNPVRHIPEIETSRRQKWLSQIQFIVHQLHALDIVWGDAKTANILLDKNDDLWVVDFGGGGTPGWIDTKLIDTKEGDLQALERICEEIGGKRRVWRSDERKPTDPDTTDGVDKALFE